MPSRWEFVRICWVHRRELAVYAIGGLAILVVLVTMLTLEREMLREFLH